MASLPGERAPSPSLHHGIRLESVLLAVGEQSVVKISSASRMNKAVAVFLKRNNLLCNY